MAAESLFYQYYDVLFAGKDYSAETDLMFQLSRRYGIGEPASVVEIGCGTGNHTEHFASRRLKQLTAIDIDPHIDRRG